MKVLQLTPHCMLALAILLAVAGCGDANLSVEVSGKGVTLQQDGSGRMSGVYIGALPEGKTLVVVAEKDSRYFAMPPAEVDPNTHTWIQDGIVVKEPGQWNLHVCSMAASDYLALLHKSGSNAISELPTGATSLSTVQYSPNAESEFDSVAPGSGTGSPASSSPRVAPGFQPDQSPAESPEPSVFERGGISPIVAANDAPKQSLPDSPPITTDDNPGQTLPHTNAEISEEDIVLIRCDKPVTALGRLHRIGVMRTNIRERAAITPAGVKVLNIHYAVRDGDEFNGWWMKLRNANWSAYADWNLVLRIAMPGTCTRNFKIELKTALDGGEAQHTEEISITDRQMRMMREDGFLDLSFPLRTFGQAFGDPTPTLSNMTEFVIVFENWRVTEIEGDLQLHSIRLAPPVAADPLDGDALLDALGKKAFLWFKANRHPETGLVLDRAPNVKFPEKRPDRCSIASVGYYLSMLPEAVRLGQIEKDEAVAHSQGVLRFVLDHLEHHHGIFHHFVSSSTGKPAPGSEVSLLDSAIFFNGCMVAAEAFQGEVTELSDKLLDRVEWDQFIVQDPETDKPVLSFGWKDGKGLLGPMDVRSTELAMSYFLAIGSRTHPVDVSLWYNTRVVRGDVAGFDILNPSHALFTSYYGLGWHDLRGLIDQDGVDLDANARLAALANRKFCRVLSDEYDAYSQSNGGWWCLSAGDSPKGYRAPGPVASGPDGTVWPTAALAAITWIPEELHEDLEGWRKSPLWSSLSGPYGLAPANPGQNWVGPDLIGIDLGSFYINLANLRKSTVRDLWMRHPVAVSALQKLNFTR